MSWLITILSAILCAAGGLFGMFGIAALCIKWYKISSFEGGSGYFAVFLSLFGGIGGLIIGVVAARLAHAHISEAWYVQPLVSLGSVAVVLGLVLAFSYMRADLEPRSDGKSYSVLWELRLPADNPADPFAPKTPPAQWPEAELKLQLVNILYDKPRGHELAVFDKAAFRLEDGQWVLPARVPLFTRRGKFCVNLTYGGRDDGFWPYFTGGSPEVYHGWSNWDYTNKGRGKPEAQATMYRFRFELDTAPAAADDSGNTAPATNS